MPVRQDTKSFLAFDLSMTLPYTTQLALANATIIDASLRVFAKTDAGSAFLNVWACTTDFEPGEVPELLCFPLPDPQDTSRTIPVYPLYFDDESKNYLPEQQVVVLNTTLSPYQIDITGNLKQAVDFGSLASFCGFAFSGKTNTQTIFIANEAYGTSSYRPFVEIRYRNNVGIEGYWDYDQYNVGKDSIYINKYNDALTLFMKTLLLHQIYR